MTWRTSDLPLELSRGPVRPQFIGQKGDHAVVFFPGWLILNPEGVALASVARGIDATFLSELMNARFPQ